MHKLAERLLATLRKQELVRAGDRVAVAVSGGADSVALLQLLVELRGEIGIVLSVAHVNHKLRGEESDGDEVFVRGLADIHKLEFLTHTAAVTPAARSGIEGEARRLRYGFFRSLLEDRKATRIATAHTLDDQSETVLLRMFRGTGIRGLGGIHPRLRLKKDDKVCGEVVRPLLNFRRAELRGFLQERDQCWREDSSNRDETFLRNRVRGRLLPLIVEEFGDAAIEHMAELAEIARAEEELWSTSAELQAAVAELDVDRLLALPLAVRRRTVRAWIEAKAPDASTSFRLIEEILELAQGATGRTIDLPISARSGDADPSRPEVAYPKKPHLKVCRARTALSLERESGPGTTDYEYLLTVPGEISILELKLRLRAQVVDVESVPEDEREGLLEPTRLGEQVVIRNWRAGDRYWPAHTKQERKVKELLNEKHITGPEKRLWPVMLSGKEIVWMRGFAAPGTFRARNGKGIWMRETPDPHA